MYKSAVRFLIKRSIAKLNEGNYQPALDTFAKDGRLCFPGDNSWAREFRPIVRSRRQHITHSGTDEIEAFFAAYIKSNIKMEVEDILVNGPPWATRAAVRVNHWIADDHGVETYTQRAVFMVNVKFGKVQLQEDYEDTERIAAHDTSAQPAPYERSGKPSRGID